MLRGKATRSSWSSSTGSSRTTRELPRGPRRCSCLACRASKSNRRSNGRGAAKEAGVLDEKPLFLPPHKQFLDLHFWGPGKLAYRFELRGSRSFLEPPDGHGVYCGLLPQRPHAQTPPLAYLPQPRAVHLHEAHGTFNRYLT